MNPGTQSLVAMINESAQTGRHGGALTVVEFDRHQDRAAVALSPTTTCWIAPVAAAHAHAV